MDDDSAFDIALGVAEPYAYLESIAARNRLVPAGKTFGQAWFGPLQKSVAGFDWRYGPKPDFSNAWLRLGLLAATACRVHHVDLDNVEVAVELRDLDKSPKGALLLRGWPSDDWVSIDELYLTSMNRAWVNRQLRSEMQGQPPHINYYKLQALRAAPPSKTSTLRTFLAGMGVTA